MGGDTDGATGGVDTDLEEARRASQRCSKCKRITKGHEGLYGSKCELIVLSDEDLRNDDLKKLTQKNLHQAVKLKNKFGFCKEKTKRTSR